MIGKRVLVVCRWSIKQKGRGAAVDDLVKANQICSTLALGVRKRLTSGNTARASVLFGRLNDRIVSGVCLKKNKRKI